MEVVEGFKISRLEEAVFDTGLKPPTGPLDDLQNLGQLFKKVFLNI
jgi:hypothetical protein